MSVFYVIVSLLVILPDLYIRLVCLRGVDLGWWALPFWAPLAFFIVLLVTYFAGGAQPFVFKGMVASLLCFTVPKLIFCIFSLLGRGAGLIAWSSGSSDVLRGGLHTGFDVAGIVVAGCFLLSAVYGLVYGPRRLVVREETLAFKDLPASFDGYRIVHLSDLHVGGYAASGMMEKLVSTVNGLDADMIAFTGDLVNSSPSELDTAVTAALSSMRARDGVFSVVGNHDYCEYHDYSTADGAARAFAEVVRREREMGWKVLMDSSAVIVRPAVRTGQEQDIGRKEDSIYIIGVEHCGKPPFGSRGDLQKALAGVPPVFFLPDPGSARTASSTMSLDSSSLGSDSLSMRAASPFKILLSHDPSHWRMEVLPQSDIQLTLSGHTHAMQFRIGRFSPSRWMYREWYGIYRKSSAGTSTDAAAGVSVSDARILNVSAGFGGSFPFRLGAWPEIVVITLRCSD